MEVKYQLFVLFVILCYLGNVAPKYFDCSKKGSIKSIMISGGCNPAKSNECELKRNTNASVEVQFVSKEVTSKVQVSVHGIIAHIPVKFPVPDADACAHKESGITCPTKEQLYTYRNVIPVLAAYPKLKVAVKWELLDQNDDDLLCFVMNVQIVD